MSTDPPNASKTAATSIEPSAPLTNSTQSGAPQTTPVVFLIGPPGVGKTTLGRRACARLGLEFLEPGGIDHWDFGSVAGHADVVVIPWQLQQDSTALAAARRAGEVLLLWAHPLEMQARSGHEEPLFTPSARRKTRGGFGRRGTSCREFRRLDRAATETVVMVDMDLEEATSALVEYLAYLRELPTHPPEVRAGLAGWPDCWRMDTHANAGAANELVAAMARYILELEATGTSTRTLRAIRSDLDAAGLLVFMYEHPKPGDVLCCFTHVPWELEFRRKFTDRPALVARYRKTMLGFAAFLERSGASA